MSRKSSTYTALLTSLELLGETSYVVVEETQFEVAPILQGLSRGWGIAYFDSIFHFDSFFCLYLSREGGAVIYFILGHH